MIGVREIFKYGESLELSLEVSSSSCATITEIDEVPLNILTVVCYCVVSIAVSSHLHVAVVVSSRVVVEVRVKECNKCSVTKS